MLSSIAGQSFFGIDLKSLAERFRRIRKGISTRYLLIDFGLDKITLCELSVKGLNIRFDHLQEIPLPLEALDRGIPVDAIEMSALIREYCREEGVPAHRAIVGIHEDALYLTTIKLPAQLAEEIITQGEFSDQVEAMIPVQVANYEVSLSLCAPPLADDDNASYLISALPKKYLDQLVDTLANSNHQISGVYPSSLIQSVAVSRLNPCLSPEEFILILDFRREHTLATLHFQGPPIRVSRLTAVPALISLSIQSNEVISAEQRINSSNASNDKIPNHVDEFDLRMLAKEINAELDLFLNIYPKGILKNIFIIQNSYMHPSLPAILQGLLGHPAPCQLHKVHHLFDNNYDYKNKLPTRILSLASTLLGNGLSNTEEFRSNAETESHNRGPLLTLIEQVPTDHQAEMHFLNNTSIDMAIAKLPPSILASTGDSEQIPKHGYGHINHAYDGEGDRASARTQFVDSSPSRANDATSQHPVSHKESTDSIIVEHNKYVNESVVSKTDDLRRNNEQQSEASSLSSLNNKIWKDVDDAMPQDRQVSNSIIGSEETIVKSSEDGIQVFNEDILENAVSLLPQEELPFQPMHSQIKPNHDPEDSYSSSAQPTQYAFNRDNDFMSTQAIDDHSTTNIRPGDQPQYIDKNLSKETNAEGLKRAISGLNLDKLFDDYARKSSTLQFPSAQDNVNDNKT